MPKLLTKRKWRLATLLLILSAFCVLFAVLFSWSFATPPSKGHRLKSAAHRSLCRLGIVFNRYREVYGEYPSQNSHNWLPELAKFLESCEQEEVLGVALDETHLGEMLATQSLNLPNGFQFAVGTGGSLEDVSPDQSCIIFCAVNSDADLEPVMLADRIEEVVAHSQPVNPDVKCYLLRINPQNMEVESQKY